MSNDLYTRYMDWREGSLLIPNETELLAMFDREVEERRAKGQETTEARREAMLAVKSWLMACLTPDPDEEAEGDA